jgi:protein-L-isoaspartate(D-aspartate) O-methyltransferase
VSLSGLLFGAVLSSLAAHGCSRSTPGGTQAENSATSSSAQPKPTDSMTPAPPPTESSAPAGEGDPPNAQQMRTRLVHQIEIFDRPWGKQRGWDPRVLAAMKRVPRHLFMPGASIATAYRDMPHPIGYGQTISQPTVVALMTNALKLTGRETVLEIGTGSGYQAAVLSGLVGELYSIEIVEPLGKAAKKRLAELGYDNVHVRIGDGYKGWPEHAPFDRIILTAAPPEMPAALVEQLANGGIIVAPVGDVEQNLVRWTKQGRDLTKENLGAVRFVPMVPGKR